MQNRPQQHEGVVDDDNTHMSDASASASAPSAAAAAAAARPPRAPARSPPSAPASSTAPAAAATTAAASLAQSARMREAQSFFQRVVKQELQVLLARGVEREVAVRKLLHRIVASTQAPEAADVRRVMKQFQMNYDDAVRALIVKQEIGRLKRQGMDAFAAIEELTRKMQRVLAAEEAGGLSPPPTDGEQEAAAAAASTHPADPSAKGDGAVSDPADSEGVDSSSGSASSPDADVDLEDEGEDGGETRHDGQAAAAQGESVGDVATAEDGEPSAAAVPTSLSPLSLCQRIDNVSISSTPSSKFVGVPSSATAAEQADVPRTTADDAGGVGSSESEAARRDAGLQSPRSRSPTSSSSSPALVSRKRRAAPAAIAESKNGPHHPQLHHHATFPLFPSAKKPKLMEVGDGYVTVVSRKFAKPPLSPSDSPVAASSTAALRSSSVGSSSVGVGGATGGAANPHKRRREVASRSPTFEYPVSDDDDELTAAAHIVRLTKRHKSLSVNSPVATAESDVGAKSDGGAQDVPASG